MPGANEFCIYDPHHEGAEVFDSQKWKPDTPIEVEEETYRLDTINFSQPRLTKRVTRSRAATLPTIVKRLETSIEHVQPLPPRGTDVRRVIAVQESKVNEKTWHITCVPKTSAKVS